MQIILAFSGGSDEITKGEATNKITESWIKKKKPMWKSKNEKNIKVSKCNNDNKIVKKIKNEKYGI